MSTPAAGRRLWKSSLVPDRLTNFDIAATLGNEFREHIYVTLTEMVWIHDRRCELDDGAGCLRFGPAVELGDFPPAAAAAEVGLAEAVERLAIGDRDDLEFWLDRPGSRRSGLRCNGFFMGRS